ncbi:MAG: hypothetical protein LBH43_21530 [Treponema sp.]|jgi:hypothetical protein|nr:hypothetical protein [Treponema sp.]
MRLFLKKVIKACLPYGLLKLYQRSRTKRKIMWQKNAKPIIPQFRESPEFIVTLTSYGKRVKNKAPYAIYSLFSQTVQPDKIVLWLAHGTKIPCKLKKLQKLGLEIRFCEDIKSYKKLIPALAAFPNDVLVTVDDDASYPPEWFKTIKEAYINDPQKIHCYRVHEIILDENKKIITYMEWRRNIKSIEYSKRIFPIGIGGILYPPNTFTSEVMNKDKFQSLAPTGDDIWFWAMVHHNNKEYNLVKNCNDKIVDFGRDDGLYEINKVKNDEQIQNVIKEYPDVYEKIK